jgi:hypothetical protein
MLTLCGCANYSDSPCVGPIKIDGKHIAPFPVSHELIDKLQSIALNDPRFTHLYGNDLAVLSLVDISYDLGKTSNSGDCDRNECSLSFKSDKAIMKFNCTLSIKDNIMYLHRVIVLSDNNKPLVLVNDG